MYRIHPPKKISPYEYMLQDIYWISALEKNKTEREIRDEKG
jgi:hypothetical protein